MHYSLQWCGWMRECFTIIDAGRTKLWFNPCFLSRIEMLAFVATLDPMAREEVGRMVQQAMLNPSIQDFAMGAFFQVPQFKDILLIIPGPEVIRRGLNAPYDGGHAEQPIFAQVQQLPSMEGWLPLHE